MKIAGYPGKVITAVAIAVIAAGTLALPAQAAVPHQNPQTAPQFFNGIDLFRYYSGALDLILKKNPEAVKSSLERLPFSNIPESVAPEREIFAATADSLALAVVEIDAEVNRVTTYLAQYRLEEASQQAEATLAVISRAEGTLKQNEDAIRATAEGFQTSPAPAESDLYQAYEETLQRIAQIGEMLDRYRETLSATKQTVEEGLSPGGEALQPTEITFTVQPTDAYVGDKVNAQGSLTSNGKALSGRRVDILGDGIVLKTVMTDHQGHYDGTFSVPYRYVTEMELQALYYPRDDDIGRYLSSVSPPVKLDVLFFYTTLELNVADEAYPGLETAISGRFYYRGAPPPEERKIEIYLDDELASSVTAGDSFSTRIAVPADTAIGHHTLTLSSAATGRYNPVVASADLYVTRAVPFIDISLPQMVVIPSGIDISGRVSSAVGPLSGALVKIDVRNSPAEFTSDEDGAFAGEIRVGPGFDLFGIQKVSIQVTPEEPWHEPLAATRNLVMVNYLNCGLLLCILIALGILLPHRFAGLMRAYASRQPRPAAAKPPTVTAVPQYSSNLDLPDLPQDGTPPADTPKSLILRWYRTAYGLVQRITRGFLRPSQTLREFAIENSPKLGRAGPFFLALTRMAERLIYSSFEPTAQEIKTGQQLSDNLEKEIKNAGI